VNLADARPPRPSPASRQIRKAAAQWELDGPRRTAPITPLKMPAISGRSKI